MSARYQADPATPPLCRLGDRLLRLARFFGLLDLGDGSGFRFLHRLAVLRELFQLRFEFGAARGDFLEQLVGGVLAQAGEFFDAQRVQIDFCHWNLPFAVRYREGMTATRMPPVLSTGFVVQR